MFKILTLIGRIFTGNIFCSAMEKDGGFSLEGDIDGVMQCLAPMQISAANPTTKLGYLKIFWETARATHDAYNIEEAAEVAAEVSKQQVFLREKFDEMQLTLGDVVHSLTLQSMGTQMESFAAYKYYKNAYNTEKKLLKASNEES